MYSCTCIFYLASNSLQTRTLILVKIRTTAKVSTNKSHTSTTAEYFSSLLDEKCDAQLSALRQQVLNDITVLMTVVLMH